MSLRDLTLKRSYDSDIDDILRDFYIPALSCSALYKRLTGFFSSTSLAVAAKGITGLISNGGSMKLISGARFRKEDIEAIVEAYEAPESVIERTMLEELENLENQFVKDHVRALGWMIATGKLKIKVAILCDENGNPLDEKAVNKRGIFHQKVGVLKDVGGDQISFSGSDNESATGWQSNIEEFKVFKSWVDSEKEYFDADLSKFEKFWQGYANRTRVIDIPRAIEEELIEMAPENVEELDLDRWTEKKGQDRLGLRNYQVEAIKTWFANDKKGIFEMATGTGKTMTALGCLREILRTQTRLIVIVCSPFIHLSEQWIREINKINISCTKLVADSSQSKWRDNLTDSIMDVENGISHILIVLTTHNTFSSADFINIILKSKERMPTQKLLLIVDEVHGIGAPERKKGLIKEYDFRLGLSATPKRWFDYEGTEKIFDYFGDVVFQFSLRDAIEAGHLTPYVYKPHFTHLTSQEMAKYELETSKVCKAYYSSKDDEKKDRIFTLLCIKRQKIIRNATNKLAVFENILNELDGTRHWLIYCSPQQIHKVQNILNKRNIIQHKFTQAEGTRPERRFGWLSERDFLIKQFSEGIYRALVSMRCLDEGVDVPPARIAIMLANSGNPREYIQRRGRVLRKFPGKKYAVIHDIIVEPTLNPEISNELKSLETKIVIKELRRYKEFASSAKNATECLGKISKIEATYGL
jgi:superfamily II DNA or RNA helicase